MGTRFEIVRTVSLGADEAWRRITDWRRWGDFAPLTTVTVEAPRDGGLERFVARTGLGPLALRDPMEVTQSRAPTSTQPGRARIVKRGRVALGWAVLTVSAIPEGCEVRWLEEARVRAMPELLSAAVDRVVALGLGRMFDGLLSGDASDVPDHP